MDSKLGPAQVDADVAPLAQQEADYEAFVWRNLRRNYVGHYLHGMLGLTGLRLINAPTFLPAYLHMLSGSNTVVGLGLALQQLGAGLSPIIGASQVEHRTRVMPSAMWMGGLARVQILGMALAGWFLSGQSRVIAILGFIFLFGLFMGVQRVAFSILIAKVIPISRRGRLQAWRNATGGVIAAGLSYMAGRWFIQPNLLGNGYSTTFLFAFVLTSLGLSALTLLMIEPQPPTVRPRVRLIDRFRDFPALLADRDFRNFLLATMLSMMGRMALPFYVLFAAGAMRLTGANLGLLSVAFLGADTVTNLIWGYLGDRSGFRVVFLLSLALWIGATILLLQAPSISLIALAFAGLGASQAGYQMSSQTMILEFGVRDEMPMRVALAATVEALISAVAPLLGGMLATLFGYPQLFVVSIAFLAAGFLLLLTAVREPRIARLAGPG